MTLFTPRHTKAPAATGSLGTWTFLLSDWFSFFALFATYGVLRVQAPVWRTAEEPRPFLSAALLLTLTMFLSSLTLVLAERALSRSARAGAAGQSTVARWVLGTFLLGAGFLVGQAVEYRLLYRAGLTLQSGPAGSTFYVLSGFHGLHVAAGLMVNGVLLWRAARGVLDEGALRVGALYWHFVVGIWTAIVAAVYLLSWEGLALAFAGVGCFFYTQLRPVSLPFRLGVAVPLVLPALYTLALLLEAWSRVSGPTQSVIGGLP